MDEQKVSKKSIVITMCIAVLCLVVIIFTSTYAYFKPQIVGDGATMNVIAGKVKLSISEEAIMATNLAPILDSTKDTKAAKNTFTISSTDESNLNACYSLDLVVTSIADNLKNEYFKYELTYGDGQTIEGDFSDFSTRTPDKNGEVAIPLLYANQSVTTTNRSNTYTLRLWLSYDENVDQTSLLFNNSTKQPTSAESRSFEAYIHALGVSGDCK